MGKVNIGIECQSCGADLQFEFDAGRSVIGITPCPICIDAAEDIANQKGYDEGHEAGFQAGLDQGRYL